MDYIVRLVFFISIFFSPVVYAGYAQAVPSSSFSVLDVKSGGTLGQMAVRAAANDAVVKSAANEALFIRKAADVTVNVGGRAVTMPVAARVAANAPLVAARWSFGNPALFLGVGVAAAAYYYYNTQGFSIENDPTTGKPIWVVKSEEWEGVFYTENYKKSFNKLQYAFNDACGTLSIVYKLSGCWLEQVYDDAWNVCGNYPNVNAMSCPVGITVVGKKVNKNVPATQQQFESAFSDPLPQELPQKLPTPLPIENPVLNPSADPVPKPQPLRVPQGDPIPIPNTNPQQYKSPAVDIVPSPTPDDPWRVDVQPKDIITESPDPLPETAPVPSPGDNTQTGQTEVPKEDTPGMCDLYPDILACAKPELDTPEADELKTKEIDIQLNPDGGWSTGGGACPPARQLHVANVQFDIKGVCDGLTMLRPVVLAFAWLLAAVIVVGATKKD